MMEKILKIDTQEMTHIIAAEGLRQSLGQDLGYEDIKDLFDFIAEFDGKPMDAYGQFCSNRLIINTMKVQQDILLKKEQFKESVSDVPEDNRKGIHEAFRKFRTNKK